MNITCAYCGVVGTKADMIVSKKTKRGYCMDERACGIRVGRKVKEASRARA